MQSASKEESNGIEVLKSTMTDTRRCDHDGNSVELVLPPTTPLVEQVGLQEWNLDAQLLQREFIGCALLNTPPT